MTGWISDRGRLAGAPRLRHGDDGGAYCYAHVIVTSRVKGPGGTWVDGPSTNCSLTVFGEQAVGLCDTAARCGNILVQFCGPFRVENYRAAGGAVRTSVNVYRADVAAAFGGYTVTVERKDGAPIGSRPPAGDAGEVWGHDVDRPGPGTDVAERFGPGDDPWNLPAVPAAQTDEGLFDPPAHARPVGRM